MKRLPDIVCTLCGLLLFSCGQQYEPELIAIDSMADASPDSAAVLLSEVDTQKVSESNRMYYYLLRAKASLNQGFSGLELFKTEDDVIFE